VGEGPYATPGDVFDTVIVSETSVRVSANPANVVPLGVVRMQTQGLAAHARHVCTTIRGGLKVAYASAPGPRVWLSHLWNDVYVLDLGPCGVGTAGRLSSAGSGAGSGNRAVHVVVQLEDVEKDAELKRQLCCFVGQMCLSEIPVHMWVGRSNVGPGRGQRRFEHVTDASHYYGMCRSVSNAESRLSDARYPKECKPGPALTACLDAATDDTTRHHVIVAWVRHEAPTGWHIPHTLEKLGPYMNKAFTYHNLDFHWAVKCDRELLPLAILPTEFAQLKFMVDGLRQSVVLALGAPTWGNVAAAAEARVRDAKVWDSTPARVCIPAFEGEFGQGFQDFVGGPAVWDKTLTSAVVLVTGAPEFVRVNGRLFRTCRLGTSDPLSDGDPKGGTQAALSSAPSAPSADEVAHVMLRLVQSNLLELRRYVCTYPAAFSRRELVSRTVAALDAVRACVGSLRSCAVVSEFRHTMNVATQVLGEVKAFAGVSGDLHPVWVAQLTSLKHGKRIAKRMAATKAAYLRPEEDVGFGDERAMDTLLAVDPDLLCGVVVRVEPSAVCAVDPWAVKVLAVSRGPLDTGVKLLQCALTGIPYRDKDGAVMNAVVPSGPAPCTSAYVATVLTSNPGAVIRGQPLALATAAFVCVVDKCVRMKRCSDEDVAVLSHLRTTMQAYVAEDRGTFSEKGGAGVSSGGGGSLGAGAGAGAGAGLQPVDFSSLCRMLMPSIVRGRLPEDPDVFGWFVETLCRECHAYLRVHNLDEATAMRTLFQGLKSSSTAELRASVAERHALMDRVRGSLFKSQRTNCSHVAIVGLYHLLGKCGSDLGRFQSHVNSGAVTARALLAEFRPEWKATWAELALGVYGLMHHEGASRRMVKVGFTQDPMAVVDEGFTYLAGLQAAAARFLQCSEQRDLARAQKAANKRAAKCALFAKYHKVVRLFSKEEVDDMNRGRPESNQLVWREDTWLLQGHCCYPDCPQYLKDSMSKLALFNHFAYDSLLGNFVKAFHVKCLEAVKAARSWEDFCYDMKRVKFQKRELDAIPRIDEHLRSVYAAAGAMRDVPSKK
jgi:hypothetical protein